MSTSTQSIVKETNYTMFEMYPDVKLVVSAELYGFPGRMDLIKQIAKMFEKADGKVKDEYSSFVAMLNKIETENSLKNELQIKESRVVMLSDLEKNINTYLNEDEKLQIASIMMDPNDGAIKALDGGRDYSKSQYNRATTSSFLKSFFAATVF